MAGTAELQASIMREGSAEPLTMVGEAAAREAERKPPMELPTTMTGRRTTSVTNSHKKSSHSVCEYARAGFSARPKPGSVGAYTCAAARRNNRWRHQFHPSLIVPKVAPPGLRQAF